MAPQPASQCCRAVRSKLSLSRSASAAVSTDAVWITDSLLSSAFARYCRLASSPSPQNSRRFASNVPGPLEARRRLGKRHMTEQLSIQQLSSQYPSLPAWSLPNAPDLRRWQWFPPRDVSSLAEGQVDSNGGNQEDGVASWSSSPPFPSWGSGLRNWLAELGDAAATPQAIEPVDEELSSTLSATTRSLTARAFFANLQAWSETLASTRTVLEADFAHQFNELCNEFEAQLRLAGLTAEEAHEAFDILWDGLRLVDSLSNPTTASRFSDYAQPLYSAVMRGIASCRLLQPTDFGAQFWRHLLVCVSKLPESHQTARIAATILVATPSEFVDQAADILPPILRTIFSHDGKTDSRELANALRHLDLGEHASFVETTTNLLQDIRADAVCTTSAYSAWLFTLAHLPQVSQDTLFQAMVHLPLLKPPHPVQTGLDGMAGSGTRMLCDLLLTQWISRGYVTTAVQRSYHNRSLRTTGDTTALASLALAVFGLGPERGKAQCVSVYISLFKCLRMLGREGELLASVEALLQRGTRPPRHTFFESLAWVSNDLQTILRLHELYVNVVQKQRPLWPFWSVSFWDKFADQLGAALDDGRLTPGQVRFALDLPKRSYAKDANQGGAKRGLGAGTVALVEKLAVHWAIAPNLPHRVALRGVEQCRAFLAGYCQPEPPQNRASPSEEPSLLPSSPLALLSPSPPPSPSQVLSAPSSSPAILRALFHLITQDLAAARPGRTRRLQWFLEIVEREHSQATAVESRRELARWRAVCLRYRKQEKRRKRGWRAIDELPEEEPMNSTLA